MNLMPRIHPSRTPKAVAATEPALLSVNPLNVTLALLYALSLTVITLFVVHPELRLWARNHLRSEVRIVLSTINTEFADIGPVKVVKVRTRDSLLLEFYTQQDDGRSKLLQSINLEDQRDSYFNYNNHPTNLVLADMAGDPYKEILAPTLDKEMRAHLNIFRFDPTTRSFARVIGSTQLP